MHAFWLVLCGQFGEICGQNEEFADNSAKSGQLAANIGGNCGKMIEKCADLTRIRRKIEQKLLIFPESTSQTHWSNYRVVTNSISRIPHVLNMQIAILCLSLLHLCHPSLSRA